MLCYHQLRLLQCQLLMVEGWTHLKWSENFWCGTWLFLMINRFGVSKKSSCLTFIKFLGEYGKSRLEMIKLWYRLLIEGFWLVSMLGFLT